jgi:DNA-binding MarR family transcriptional regulator
MMTSQVLRTLADNALVERAQHPDDRRARALRVTEAGRELANRAVIVVEACDRAFFAALGPDVAPFTHALARLRQAG